MGNEQSVEKYAENSNFESAILGGRAVPIPENNVSDKNQKGSLSGSTLSVSSSSSSPTPISSTPKKKTGLSFFARKASSSKNSTPISTPTSSTAASPRGSMTSGSSPQGTNGSSSSKQNARQSLKAIYLHHRTESGLAQENSDTQSMDSHDSESPAGRRGSTSSTGPLPLILPEALIQEGFAAYRFDTEELDFDHALAPLRFFKFSPQLHMTEKLAKWASLDATDTKDIRLQQVCFEKKKKTKKTKKKKNSISKKKNSSKPLSIMHLKEKFGSTSCNTKLLSMGSIESFFFSRFLFFFWLFSDFLPFSFV